MPYYQHYIIGKPEKWVQLEVLLQPVELWPV